jgi:hypothetical protein
VYVLQSIYLTDDVLSLDMAFGLLSKQIDDMAVQRTIMADQFAEFVLVLPERFETVNW